jgi:uncharacterized protein
VPKPLGYMTKYLVVFLAGLAGSFHCLGMCGGFACAIGADPRGRGATLRRHLIYNSGRVSTYCFLGALSGFLGAALITRDGSSFNWAQRSLAVLSGVLMVYVGLRFLGYFQRLGRSFAGVGAEVLAQSMRDLLKAKEAAVPLAFGALNGFLPCPLVYAFAAQAAASGGPLPGILTMAAFGLGTFPAMLFMGGVGACLRRSHGQPIAHSVQPNLPIHSRSAAGRRSDWRLRGMRIAGALIALLGVITFARGVLTLAGHVHGV